MMTPIKIAQNKKGIILYATMLLMVVTVLIVLLSSQIFHTFAQLSAAYHDDTRSRCLMECGLARGLWLVTSGHGPLPGSPFEEELTIGTENVSLQISLDAQVGLYTITVTNNSKTMTAQVNSTSYMIVGWR